jgi:hypothetical protein
MLPLDPPSASKSCHQRPDANSTVTPLSASEPGSSFPAVWRFRLQVSFGPVLEEVPRNPSLKGEIEGQFGEGGDGLFENRGLRDRIQLFADLGHCPTP